MSASSPIRTSRSRTTAEARAPGTARPCRTGQRNYRRARRHAPATRRYRQPRAFERRIRARTDYGAGDACAGIILRCGRESCGTLRRSRRSRCLSTRARIYSRAQEHRHPACASIPSSRRPKRAAVIPRRCCSAADIVAALFFAEMRFDPQDPRHPCTTIASCCRKATPRRCSMRPGPPRARAAGDLKLRLASSPSTSKATRRRACRSSTSRPGRSARALGRASASR